MALIIQQIGTRTTSSRLDPTSASMFSSAEQSCWVQRRPPSTRYLLVDSVHLSVLVLDFRAHVDGHVAQVADHGADLAHVLLHFILARVFGDSVKHKKT